METDPKDTSNIAWYNKPFKKLDVTWLHDTSDADESSMLDDSSPAMLLGKYFTNDIIELLAEQISQRYLKKTGKPLKVTSTEMRQFIGICNRIGNLKFP